jgi:hypothetical protein
MHVFGPFHSQAKQPYRKTHNLVSAMIVPSHTPLNF